LAITRVDGILFTLGIATALFIRDGINRATFQLTTRLISLPFIFLLAQVSFRLAYYGTLVPNTAYAKLAFTMERILLGAVYLAKGALVNIVPLTAILVIGILFWRSQRREVLRRSLLFLIPGLLWLAYVCIIGGDFFGFQRHWAPALVCFSFALSHLVNGIAHVVPRQFAIYISLAAASYLVSQNIVPVEMEIGQKLRFSSALSNIARAGTIYAPHQLGDEYTQCKDFGELVSAFGSQRPLLAVYRAGCLPYRTQFPSLDMLGLTDSHIAHRRPSDMGKGIIGHELGDVGYVLSRKPDLIEHFLDCPLDHALCRLQREMVNRTDFQESYRLVFFGVGDGVRPLWARAEQGRVGIKRSATTISIPGFLLAGSAGARAVLSSDQKLVTELDYGDAAIQNVYIPAGAWEVSLVADSPETLQVMSSPQDGVTVIRPNTLHIASNGTTRSFTVFGGRGKIRAIVARAVQ
jgi:hypothetical protein